MGKFEFAFQHIICLSILTRNRKSQIGIHFAHQLHKKQPETFVFWVFAGSRPRFEEAYRNIANRLQLIEGRDSSRIDVLQLVFEWLSDSTNGPWLMILDNADKIDLFFPGDQQSIPTEHKMMAQYLPQCGHGKILITSRSKDVAERLTGSSWNVYHIPPMEEGTAKHLLKKKLRTLYDPDTASELVQTLEYIPLAITQAAAFIIRRWPRMTPSKYLDEFRKSDLKKQNLLKRDMPDLQRDFSASNSVVVTWRITYEQIEREQPSAADLLLFMSFFHPQGIPRYMLQSYHRKRSVKLTAHDHFQQVVEEIVFDGDVKEFADASTEFVLDEAMQTLLLSDTQPREAYKERFNKRNFEKSSLYEDELDEDLETLFDYSLISHVTENTYKMHALVQFCTLASVSSLFQIEHRRGKAIEVIAQEYRPSDWKKTQELEPHVAQFVTNEPLVPSQEWAWLLKGVGWYKFRMGNSEEAIKTLVKAVQVQEQLMGSIHFSTMEYSTILLVVLFNVGELKNAELLARRAIRFRKAIPKYMHLTYLNLLAGICNSQERHEEAEKILGDIIADSTELSEQEIPVVLQSIDILIWTYSARGNSSTLAKLLDQSLQLGNKLRRADPVKAFSFSSRVMHSMLLAGMYKEAIIAYPDLLSRSIAVYGEDHKETLCIKFYYSQILFYQGGDWELYENILQEIVNADTEIFGGDPSDTVDLMSKLLMLLLDNKKFHEAEKVVRGLIRYQEKTGEEPREALFHTRAVLGLILIKLPGRNEEAETILVPVLQDLEKMFGKDTKHTLNILAYLAENRALQHRFEDAEQTIHDVIVGRTKILGEEHPDTMKARELLHWIKELEEKEMGNTN